MAKKSVLIDGNRYMIDDLSIAAKEQIASIQFVDDRILQLNNEWAIADTARLVFMRALTREVIN